jgi:hypothetical protein
MPPGITCPRPPAHIAEKMTALACIEIARRIQRTRHHVGDLAGADAAGLVARTIQEDLLGEGSPLASPWLPSHRGGALGLEPLS